MDVKDGERHSGPYRSAYEREKTCVLPWKLLYILDRFFLSYASGQRSTDRVF